jgi:anti-anti-sigma factor
MVRDPDGDPATLMLQVFVVPAARHDADCDAVVLKMVGELCAYSAALVEPAMRRFVEYADSVVIDLSDLRFLDAAGLQLLNGLADGTDVLRLENVDTRLARIFEIAGLGRLLRGRASRAAS